MLINRAYKTGIKPNKTQQAKLNHYSDVVRFCYNWMLGRCNDEYENVGKRPFTSQLIKEFRATRKEQWPWTVGACARCEETAGKMLDGGYQKFFEYVKSGKLSEMQKGKRPRKDGKPYGFPRFKSRRDGFVSCKFWGLKPDAITDRTIKLQGLGTVRLHEDGYIPTDVKVISATVGQRAGHWFVSVQVEEEVPDEAATGRPVGVDVGIATLATTSDGRYFENPKALNAALRKLAHLSRQLARQEKDSNRRAVTKEKIAKLHYRISNIRSNATHAATSEIIGVHRPAEERPSTVAIEDLNVAGMVKNHRLASALLDANMSELHRQLEYKGGWNGVSVEKVGRFFPSSKMCSACGHVLPELKLSRRTFNCPECGLVLDRDENAAVNLKQAV